MILFLLYQALFILEISNITYEQYNSETIKKKREYTMKPFFYNRRTIILLVIFLTIFFLSYDY